MPPRKKYRKYKSKRPLSKAQYKQVAKIANKQIYKNQELKTVDSAPAANAGIASGDVAGQTVTYPIQGITSSTRIGDSIYLRSVSLRGFVNCGTDVNNILRVLTVQWLEDSSVTACTLGKILEDTTAGNLLSSHYLPNPQYRFRILDDTVYTWDANNASAPKPWSVKIQGKMLAKHKPDFATPASAASDGDIHVFVLTDAAAGVGQLYNQHHRVRYLDG